MHAKFSPLLTFGWSLKLFVYEKNHIPSEFYENEDSCSHHVFGAESWIPSNFRSEPNLVTLNPREADLFYVPMNIACVYYGNARVDSKSMDETLLLQMDFLLDRMLESLPYFKIMNGKRHVFNLFFKGLFPKWRQKLANRVILTPETEVEFEISSSYFDEWNRIAGSFPPFDWLNDIVLPPWINHEQLKFFASHSSSLRPWFVSFFGKRWVDVDEGFVVRENMIRVFQNRPDSYIHAVDRVKDFVPLERVAQVMGQSQFCLIPRGRSAWTTRFFDALWAGCVPVVLSDYFRLPFPSSVDALSLMIRWPTDSIDESLVEFLKNVSEQDIANYQASARNVRHLFVYPEATKLLLKELDKTAKTYYPYFSPWCTTI